MMPRLYQRRKRRPNLTQAQKRALCDRADRGEPILNLTREFDLHRAAFYHLYADVRGVTWSQNHPRAFKRHGTHHYGKQMTPYHKYAHLARGDQWYGTPAQLVEYLDFLKAQESHANVTS